MPTKMVPIRRLGEQSNRGGYNRSGRDAELAGEQTEVLDQDRYPDRPIRRGVNLLCHGRARASFSLTLRAGAMRLERIGRLGGAAAAGGGRDALSYGVSFATTRSHPLARGGALTSFVTV